MAISIFLMLAILEQECRAEMAVVLVVYENSPIRSISALDIRKAYLGISVVVEGQNIRPLRLRSDDHLNQIFLQSIIAMSQKSYERRLLSLLLKYGTPRPVEVDDHKQLVALLAKSSATIAYMWKRDAESDERIRIVRVLWQES